MTSGQGNNPTFRAFSQRAFMRHSEPVCTDKRILQTKNQRNGLPVACPSDRHQIARDFNGNRAIYKHFSTHPSPSNAHGLLATSQARIETARNPQNGEWIAEKGAKFNQLACESGASYRTAAPVLIGQGSYFVPCVLSTKSARRSQRVGSASQTVQPSPPTPRADLAGALLSGRA